MLVAVRQGMRTQRGGQSGCWSSLLLSSRALNVSPSLLSFYSPLSGVHLPSMCSPLFSSLITSTPHSLYQFQEVCLHGDLPCAPTRTQRSPAQANASPRTQRITLHARSTPTRSPTPHHSDVITRLHIVVGMHLHPSPSSSPLPSPPSLKILFAYSSRI